MGKKPLLMASKNTKYSVVWESDPLFRGWLARSNRTDGATRARCIWCSSDFSVAHGGKNDVTKHMRSDQHKKIVTARAAQKPCTEYRGK